MSNGGGGFGQQSRIITNHESRITNVGALWWYVCDLFGLRVGFQAIFTFSKMNHESVNHFEWYQICLSLTLTYLAACVT